MTQSRRAMIQILSLSESTTGKKWSEFENLLMEAVQRTNFAAVEMLLEHEIKIEEIYNITHPVKFEKPLLFSAKHEQLHILKLFYKHHYTIPPPHVTNCHCEKCENDKLGQMMHRLSTLSALSSPIWISLTSEDPFMTCFELCQQNRTFCEEDDSFGTRYQEISEANEKLCLELLDEIESEKEGTILMCHKSISMPEDTTGIDLAFINLAIDYCLKEVVAHPVTQHFVSSRVFDEIPGWRTSGIIYKFFLVIGIGILYPITTICNILFPSECCTSIANIAMKPFVKFVNGAASFITFLILLMVMGARHSSGLRIGKPPSAIELLVFIWLLGFCVGEIKQVYRRGVVDYLSCGWNWIDIGMDILMLLSYIVWFILYFHGIKEQVVRNLADGMFATAIILSFFRVVYLCQITSYLGLLQLCLSRMVQIHQQRNTS